ncbi:MAG: hypothetical protein IJ680_05310 [Paludibacteraceae bacterium]|nr:hypothetical protein [Paludibacteraceae bacterium]
MQAVISDLMARAPRTDSAEQALNDLEAQVRTDKVKALIVGALLAD